MQTIRLEVEDSKLETVLNIIQNLKESLITRYEISSDEQEIKDFKNVSQNSLRDIWDNKEDSLYDKFL